MFAIISLFALKLLFLPSFLFEDSNNYSIFEFAVLICVDIIFLFLILKVKQKYPDKTFFSLIVKIFGNFFSKIIFIALTLFFMIKFLYLGAESYNYLRDALLDEANIVLFLVCFLPVVNVLAWNGIKGLFRTNEFFFVILLVCFILCIWFSFGTTTEPLFFDFGEFKVDRFLNSTLSRFMWFGDFLFVAIILDKLPAKKKDHRKIFAYAVLGVIFLLFFMFAFLRLFQNTSFLHSNAISEITQFNGEFAHVGKIEIISIGFIMFTVFFQGALFIFCGKECATNIVNNPLGCQTFICTVPVVTSIFIVPGVLGASQILYWSSMFLSPVLFVFFTIFFLITLLKKNKKLKERPSWTNI